MPTDCFDDGQVFSRTVGIAADRFKQVLEDFLSVFADRGRQGAEDSAVLVLAVNACGQEEFDALELIGLHGPFQNALGDPRDWDMRQQLRENLWMFDGL